MKVILQKHFEDEFPFLADECMNRFYLVFIKFMY